MLPGCCQKREVGRGMAQKRTFRTDRQLQALKPGADWADWWDEVQPGLAVRVGPRAADGRFRRTFVMVARFGAKNASRRRLGEYPGMSLSEAREKAQDWRKLVGKGLDPAREEMRTRRKRQTDAANTFGAVAERYISEHLGETVQTDGTTTYAKRRGRDDAREIRRLLVKPWRDQPVVEITPQHVKELIRPLARQTPAQAHLTLGHVKRIFGWLLNDDLDHGVTQSPAAILKPRALIGERRVRTRVFDDGEWRAFWNATGKLGYPMGDLYRLIAFTGVRISEASDAAWSEFNFGERLWRIPAARFKSEQEHLIPLSDAALALLSKLPEWRAGPFLFSSTGGRSPVNGFSKPKARLDKLMREHLGEFQPFVIHDVRRTVRTRLSMLRVEPQVAELVLGHARKGLARVYDLHSFLPEMTDALERWARELLLIVGEAKPESDQVVELKTRATA